MSKEVYLDHAASAIIAPEVVEHIMGLFGQGLGNASSIHRSGVRASNVVEISRALIAEKCRALPEEIVFTSGATEANNLALIGFVRANIRSDRNEVVLSEIEHPSVLGLVSSLEKDGAIVRRVPVDASGLVQLGELKNIVSRRTLLVSIGHANGEIGVIQDLSAIADICESAGAILHSDGAQSFCKTDFDFTSSGVGLYSLSGHKIHGPKGIGALVIRKGISVAPISGGGGQENGLRSGTLPVEIIGGFGKAVRLWNADVLVRLRELRGHLTDGLRSLHKSVRFNGDVEKRLVTNLNFSIPGFQGKALLQGLDRAGVRVSVGSACSAGKKTASSVLLAIGRAEDEANEALRVSFGLQTTRDEVSFLVSQLARLIAERD